MMTSSTPELQFTGADPRCATIIHRGILPSRWPGSVTPPGLLAKHTHSGDSVHGSWKDKTEARVTFSTMSFFC